MVEVIAFLAAMWFIACAYLVNGLAVSLLWGWFVVPLGAPPLPIAVAIGIGILVGVLTNHNVPKKDEKIDTPKHLMATFLNPVLAMVTGWIVHRFFMGGS